jgi:hypothetical protein
VLNAGNAVGDDDGGFTFSGLDQALQYLPFGLVSTAERASSRIKI